MCQFNPRKHCLQKKKSYNFIFNILNRQYQILLCLIQLTVSFYIWFWIVHHFRHDKKKMKTIRAKTRELLLMVPTTVSWTGTEAPKKKRCRVFLHVTFLRMLSEISPVWLRVIYSPATVEIVFLEGLNLLMQIAKPYSINQSIWLERWKIIILPLLIQLIAIIYTQDWA